MGSAGLSLLVGFIFQIYPKPDTHLMPQVSVDYVAMKQFTVGQTVLANVIYTNHGSIPAENARGWGVLGVFDHPITVATDRLFSRPLPKSFFGEAGNLLVPGRQIMIPLYGGDHALTESDSEKIARKEWYLHAWGMVSYENEDGQSDTLEYCFRWEPGIKSFVYSHGNNNVRRHR